MFNNNGFYKSTLNRLNRLNENNNLNTNKKNFDSFKKELKNIDSMSINEKEDFFYRYIIRKIYKGELSAHQERVTNNALIIFNKIINNSSYEERITRIKKLFTYIKDSKSLRTYPDENHNHNNLRKIPGNVRH
jgi:hypothetical protein